MKTVRTQVFEAVAVIAVLALTSSGAMAQSESNWPTKPIQIIVAFAAGGPIDRVARVIAPALQAELEVSVIVDNKPGASGIIAQQYVMNSRDEHTIMLHTSGGHSVRPHTMKLNFDPWKTLLPVAAVASVPTVYVGSAKSQWKNMADLVKYGKQNPGKINFGIIGGLGTTNHIAAEMFKDSQGIVTTNVPYNSWPQSLPALLTGEIDVANAYMPVAVPQIQAGKLIPYAVASEKRSRFLPAVPTTAEAGMPGVLNSDLCAIFVPVGMLPARVKKLQLAVDNALKDNAVREAFTSAMFEQENMTQEELIKYMRDENTRVGALVAAHNIRTE